MRFNPEKAHLPMELLRTLVAVSKSSSFTHAAESLGCAPSIVQAHMSELEAILGTPIFERAGAETKLSKDGVVVLSYAARMLSINDQLLAQSRARPVAKKWRIGLPRWVLERDLIDVGRGCAEEIGVNRASLHCDDVEHLVRDLEAGLLDIAVLCNATPWPGVAVRRWREDVHWAKGSGVKIRRGEPIPIVSWPGSMSDRFISDALNRAKMDYIITFTSSELSARMAAVAAGLGVIGVTRRSLCPGTEIATESFLPPLPQTRKAICIRNHWDAAELEPVVRVLEDRLMSTATNVVIGHFGRDQDQTPLTQQRR